MTEERATTSDGSKADEAPVTPSLTREEIAEYRATALSRWEQNRQEVMRRRVRAWRAAKQAAILLKRKFGATRVVVFGSLVHEGSFTRWSDVDIAAWGLSSQDTFRAISAVIDIDQDIKVNLVDVETCSPALLAAIEQDGRDL